MGEKDWSGGNHRDTTKQDANATIADEKIKRATFVLIFVILAFLATGMIAAGVNWILLFLLNAVVFLISFAFSIL